MRSQIIGERSISVGMIAQEISIEPDNAVHVDAVEDNLHLARRRDCRRGETLAVPTRPAHKPSGVAFTGAELGIERTHARGEWGRDAPYGPQPVVIPGSRGQIFDAEIVRQIESPPRRVVEPGRLGPRSIGAKKTPALIRSEKRRVGKEVNSRGSGRHGEP